MQIDLSHLHWWVVVANVFRMCHPLCHPLVWVIVICILPIQGLDDWSHV